MILRKIALVTRVVGAIASIVLVVHAGRKNNSVILPILFVIWVLIPFIVLMVVNLVFSTRWPVITRVAFYCLTIVLTLISLGAYSGLLTPPQSKPAGVFLIVPLLSLVAMAAVIVWSRRTTNKSDSV